MSSMSQSQGYGVVMEGMGARSGHWGLSCKTSFSTSALSAEGFFQGGNSRSTGSGVTAHPHLLLLIFFYCKNLPFSSAGAFDEVYTDRMYVLDRAVASR